MIIFKQLEAGAPPHDIEVTTDDAQAELANMTDAFEREADGEFEAQTNLADAQRNEEGKFVFVIPGEEAGEVADLLEGAGVELWAFLEECNAKAIAAVEEDA